MRCVWHWARVPAAILRESVCEGLMLSVAGGLLGLGLATATIRVALRLLPESMPRVESISMNGIVVGFALILALATGVLCSFAPAFAAIRTNLTESLKEGARTGSGRVEPRPAAVGPGGGGDCDCPGAADDCGRISAELSEDARGRSRLPAGPCAGGQISAAPRPVSNTRFPPKLQSCRGRPARRASRGSRRPA